MPDESISFTEKEYEEIMHDDGKWYPCSVGIIKSGDISIRSAVEKYDL